MHHSYYGRPLFVLLVVYILTLSFFYRPAPSASDIFHKIPDKIVTLEGKVVSFPFEKKGNINAIVKVYSVDGEPVGGRVYARFKEFTPVWHDTVRITGKLKAPYSIDMFGNFDWSAYLAMKDVFTEITSSDTTLISPPSWPLRAIGRVREDILKTFKQNFEPNLSAIAGGILLGERGELDPSLFVAFQDSGAVHLLVASGGNVGFVTLMVFAFCALFGLGRKKTAVIALAVAGVYTLIAGADAPLVRAYFMTVCAVSGYMLNRNSGVFQGLIVSCLVILLFNPSSVFETGFQMSFLATLAIIICLNNYTLPYKWPKWVKFFAQIFMATLSTQLILLPIFANIFFKVSLTGLVANMLLVPMASFIMGLSFAFYVFSLLHLGFLLKWLTWLSLWLFKILVEYFAGFKLSALTAAAWPVGIIISFYTFVFLAFNLPQRAFFKRILWPCVAVMVLCPIVQHFFFNPTRIYLLSEWNKNVVLVRTSSGNTFLAGAGIDGEKLAKAVLKSGSRRVDAVFISQDGKQDIKGLAELERILPVGQVVRPFENNWPGDRFTFGADRVTTAWGLLTNREGKLWNNRGYSGCGRDSLSYEFTVKGSTFTVGANDRFIFYQDQIVSNLRNRTVKIKI